MKWNDLPFNWFDFFLVLWLTMGIFRGRKRGMSAEVMTFVQWVAIVVVCGVTHQMAGHWLAENVSVFSLLSANVTAYVVIAGLVALLFVYLKRSIGGKLVGSDAFGKSEYYLGMPAGMVRFACILIFGLALLNARSYSQAEIAAIKQYQMKNFDAELFPGLQTLQANVFQKSFTGPYIKEYLGFLLINSTPSGGGKQFKQREWQGP